MTAESKDAGAREQILNFMRLSSDIARNQHDAEFSKDGGQIIYCFDQTIFQLFFDTFQWRHAVSSFYGKDWASGGRSSGKSREEWRRIEAQSALIASEYLLSEELPGAKNDYIYLTPWHRVELADRLDKVAAAGIQDREEVANIEEEISRKLEFLRFSRRLQREEGNPFRPDATLEQDLTEIRSHIHHSSSLIRYELTRRAARMLVQCAASERLDQIHRLVSRPLRQRIKSLHQLFQPTPEEVEAIATDARQWYLRILREIELHSRDRPDRRSSGGKWSDAQSIAFVRWAAGKARSDQRIVLVTSDDRLFDAYRRWWCQEGMTESGVTEPFVLRRSFQYTPIFNLRDSRNDLSRVEGMHDEVGKLFRQIAEAIQITLLPFNLARVEESDARIGELALNQNFEYMALRGMDYKEGEADPVLDYFMGKPDSAWYEQQSKAINDIAELWRKIERIGIGFFYDQVLKRLEDDRDLFGVDDDMEADPKSMEEWLNYISSALATITDRTRRTYLPMAISFLESELKESGDLSRRAPDLLWYQLPSRQSVYDMIREWPKKTKRDRESHITELRKEAEAPFVLAAAFALAKHDWWRAEEFAEYALMAYRDQPPAPLLHLELQFLSAFAKRFRLGSSALFDRRALSERGDAARSSVRRAADLFASTEKVLAEYLELSETLKSSQLVTLLKVRGKSERAALRLFMALHRHFTGVGSEEAAEFAPLELVRAAQADILDCAKMDATVSATDLRPRKQTIRNHFLHNGAASEVVRFLIQGGNSFELDPRLAPIGKAFAQGPYRRMEGEDALVKSERIVFQILQGSADPLEWPELESALAALMQSPLTIDRRMARALSDRKDALFDRLSIRAGAGADAS